jgi:hypothetical protein
MQLVLRSKGKLAAGNSKFLKMAGLGLVNCPILSVLWLAVTLIACNYGWAGAASPLSISETLVFGPGFQENTTSLPLNYFFIQARDSTGAK